MPVLAEALRELLRERFVLRLTHFWCMSNASIGPGACLSVRRLLLDGVVMRMHVSEALPVAGMGGVCQWLNWSCYWITQQGMGTVLPIHTRQPEIRT